MFANFLFGSSRARVMSELFASHEPMSVAALASCTGLSRSTVHTELRQLAALDLVLRIKGSVVRYAPNPDHLVLLRLVSLFEAIEKFERPNAAASRRRG